MSALFPCQGHGQHQITACYWHLSSIRFNLAVLFMSLFVHVEAIEQLETFTVHQDWWITDSRLIQFIGKPSFKILSEI